VPFDFAVSGIPSPLVLFSGLFVISVECLVSVFDRPSCLPDCVVLSPAGFDEAAYDGSVESISQWKGGAYEVFVSGVLLLIFSLALLHPIVAFYPLLAGTLCIRYVLPCISLYTLLRATTCWTLESNSFDISASFLFVYCVTRVVIIRCIRSI